MPDFSPVFFTVIDTVTSAPDVTLAGLMTSPVNVKAAGVGGGVFMTVKLPVRSPTLTA